MATYISLDNLTRYDTNIKSYITSAIGAVETVNFEVVQTLPTQDISTTTIYLVPKTGSTGDVYDEYIYVSNNWELIGNTDIDLSGYYTSTQVDTLLSAKADATDIPTAGKYLTIDANNVIDANIEYIAAPNNQQIGTSSNKFNFNNYKCGKTVVNNNSTSNAFYYTYNIGGTDYSGNVSLGSVYWCICELELFYDMTEVSTLSQNDFIGKIVFYEDPGSESNTVTYSIKKNTNSTPIILSKWVTTTKSTTISGKENSSNKVTSLSSSSTDTQYPSAKCVYDALQAAGGGLNKLTANTSDGAIGAGVYEVDNDITFTYTTELVGSTPTTETINLYKGDLVYVYKPSNQPASSIAIGNIFAFYKNDKNIKLTLTGQTVETTTVTFDWSVDEYEGLTSSDITAISNGISKVANITVISTASTDVSGLSAGFYFVPSDVALATFYYKRYDNGTKTWVSQPRNLTGPLYLSVNNNWVTPNGSANMTIYLPTGTIESYGFHSIDSSNNRRYWKELKPITVSNETDTILTYTGSSFSTLDVKSNITWISGDKTVNAYINGASSTTSFTVPNNTMIYGALDKIRRGYDTIASMKPYMVLPNGDIYDITALTDSTISITKRSTGGGGSSGPAIYKVNLKAATLDTTVLKNIGDAWNNSEEHIVIGYYDDATYSIHGSSMAEEYYDTTTSTMYLTFGPIMSIAAAKYGITYRDYFNFVVSFQYFTDTGNVSNAVKSNSTSKSIRYNTSGDTENFPLGVNNTSSYTPTNDYNPATKKYVDDAVAGGGGGGTTYTAGNYINIDSNNVISGNIVLTRSTTSSSDVGTSSTKRLDLDTLKPGKYIYENYSTSSSFYYKYTQGGASSQTNTSFSISTGDTYSVFASYTNAYRIEIEVYKATSELASAATGTPMMHIRFVPANANNAEWSASSYAITVEYELYRNSSKGLSNNRIYSSVNMPNLSSKLNTISSNASTASSNANQALQATTSLDARVTALEQGGGGGSSGAHSYKCIAYGSTSGSSANLYGSSYYQAYSGLTVNASLSLNTGTSDIIGGYLSIGDMQRHLQETYSKVIVQFIDAGMYRVVGEMEFENVQFNGSGVTSTSVTSGLYTGSYFLQVFAVYDEEVQYGLYQSSSYSSSASVDFTDYMYGVATGSSVGLNCNINSSMGTVTLGFSGGMQPSNIIYPFIKKARLHVYYYDSGVAQSFDDYYDLGDFNDQYGISLNNTYIRLNSSGDTNFELLYDNSNGSGGENTMKLSSLITDTGNTYTTSGGSVPIYAWNDLYSFIDTIKNVGFTSIINDIGDLVIDTSSMNLSINGTAPNIAYDGTRYFLIMSNGAVLKAYYMSSLFNGSYEYVIMDFEKHVGDNYPMPSNYEYMRVSWEYHTGSWSGSYRYGYLNMSTA